MIGFVGLFGQLKRVVKHWLDQHLFATIEALLPGADAGHALPDM